MSRTDATRGQTREGLGETELGIWNEDKVAADYAGPMYDCSPSCSQIMLMRDLAAMSLFLLFLCFAHHMVIAHQLGLESLLRNCTPAWPT